MQEQTAPAVSELLDLEGQSALVTGASGHLGRGIAARLGEAGATVVVHYHTNRQDAEELAAELREATLVRADLSNAGDVDAMFSDLTPDLVVNNAAAQPVQSLAEMSPREWRSMLAVNLDSAFLVTRRAAKCWRAAGRPGAIVNIASIEGSDPAVGHAHYATSKAGLLMFTRAAALEFGPAGIRVNAVSPGLIDREGLADDWPEGVRRWQDRVPLGRIGSPKDVADAVLFLLCPAARWISGANLVVDGGMSAQSRW